MNKLVTAASLCTLCNIAFAGDAPHWDYAGKIGPEHWATLSPQYQECAGKNQSPVDIEQSITADLTPPQFHYHSGGLETLNNGHTLQTNYAPGNSLIVDGKTFELKQFHAHAPSENRINGKSYPMEIHLVHADRDGNLAVVAVMLSEGAENPALKNAWAQLPQHVGDKHKLAAAVATEDLLPTHRSYYRYEGSLTTPPCTEGVRWLVMQQPVTASKAQIAQFVRVLGHPNNRPVQALNARLVLK